MTLDCSIVVSSLWLSTILRPQLNGFPGIEFIQVPYRVPYSLYLIFPLVWLLILSTMSIYDGRKYLRAPDEFTALTMAMGIASISAAGILYFSFRDVSRALYILFVLLVYIMLIAWRSLVRIYFRFQRTTSDRTRRVLIVGIGPLGQSVQLQINRTAIEKLAVIGFVDNGFENQMNNPLLLGGYTEIRRIVLERQVSDVVIALPYSAYSQMDKLVQQLEDVPVRVWLALGFFDLALYRTTMEDFAGIPMLDLRASAIDDYQRMLKRAFDVFWGMVALIIVAPIMAICAFVILLEDGRPVIFQQKRVGENGRIFDMFKFRTMIKNAEQLRSLVETPDGEGNLLHKVKDDPRVTKVGHVLRRFSLDELPQFINVIRGDMSLVGPRPELPYLVEKYKSWQRKRFAIPPGLTGWWQVSGRSDKPMHLHTEDDLFYIQNYSIWLDVQILMRTAWVVIIGKGAY